jgi:hypothetical protein
MPTRTAGFGNRDPFELNGKIGLHRKAGCGSLLRQDYARSSKSNKICSLMRSDHLRSAGAAIACYRVTNSQGPCSSERE